MSPGFGDLLAAAIGQQGPLCLGMDPHPYLLEAWELPDTAQGLERMGERVLEAATGRVAAIKPQIALYERHGAAGFRVLETFLAEGRKRNILMIADAKRGDIGSTMAAYAAAWLSPDSPLASDALTVSPYLGFESLRPALEVCQRQQRGLFVLGLTSNPEGASLQHLGAPQSVAGSIIDAAEAENKKQNFDRMGSCGVVIGATVASALNMLNIDISRFNGPLLVPGYGQQGGQAADLFELFTQCPGQVLVNSGRAILEQGPQALNLADEIDRVIKDLSKGL